MAKLDSKFYRSMFIILVSFIIFGSFLYDENRDRLLSNHLYWSTDPSFTFRRSFSVNITGGHEYTIYMHIHGPAENPLTGRFTFAEFPELNFEYVLYSDGSDGEIFFDPIYISGDTHLGIYGSSNFQWSMGMRQEIRIYQNLPEYLIMKPIWVGAFVFMIFIVWFIAYNDYERIFVDIKKYRKIHLPKKTRIRIDHRPVI